MTIFVLQSGTEWGSFPAEQPVRGGGAPPTPPPRIDSTPSQTDDMSLGLQRQLRAHAGREAPADGAVEVPHAAGGAGLPRPGRGPLRQGVSANQLCGNAPRSTPPPVPVL